MKINKGILSDLFIVALLAGLGLFALACGYALDGEKLKDLGFWIMSVVLILVHIVQSRSIELKHYKDLKKEIREMQHLADNTP